MRRHGCKREIPQNTERNPRSEIDPQPDRTNSDCWRCLEFVPQNSKAEPRHDWQRQNQERIESDCRQNISVQQLMNRAQRAAAGTVQTCDSMKRADWINRNPRRVIEKQNQYP